MSLIYLKRGFMYIYILFRMEFLKHITIDNFKNQIWHNEKYLDLLVIYQLMGNLIRYDLALIKIYSHFEIQMKNKHNIPWKLSSSVLNSYSHRQPRKFFVGFIHLVYVKLVSLGLYSWQCLCKLSQNPLWSTIVGNEWIYFWKLQLAVGFWQPRHLLKYQWVEMHRRKTGFHDVNYPVGGIKKCLEYWRTNSRTLKNLGMHSYFYNLVMEEMTSNFLLYR